MNCAVCGKDLTNEQRQGVAIYTNLDKHGEPVDGTFTEYFYCIPIFNNEPGGINVSHRSEHIPVWSLSQKHMTDAEVAVLLASEKVIV